MGKMKKKLLFLTIFTIYYLLFTISASASPTPTTSTTQQIKDQLIENIASRVAELKLVEKRGFIGTVTDISNTQITLSDTKDKTRFVDVDELTKFSSPSTKESFGISDITKGTMLGVVGLYNKESRRLLARFVNVIVLPIFIHITADSIDSKNYTLDVTTEKGKLTIDVQTSTKILSYSRDTGTIRSAFSKIQENEHIIVVGFTDLKNKNIIIADRIILFPEIPSTLRVNETTPSATQSGEKTTPITQ